MVLCRLKYWVRSKTSCSRVIVSGWSNVVVGIHDVPPRRGCEAKRCSFLEIMHL